MTVCSIFCDTLFVICKKVRSPTDQPPNKFCSLHLNVDDWQLPSLFISPYKKAGASCAFGFFSSFFSSGGYMHCVQTHPTIKQDTKLCFHFFFTFFFFFLTRCKLMPGRIFATAVMVQLSFNVPQQRGSANTKQIGLGPIVAQFIFHHRQPWQSIFGWTHTTRRFKTNFRP